MERKYRMRPTGGKFGAYSAQKREINEDIPYEPARLVAKAAESKVRTGNNDEEDWERIDRPEDGEALSIAPGNTESLAGKDEPSGQTIDDLAMPAEDVALSSDALQAVLMSDDPPLLLGDNSNIILDLHGLGLTDEAMPHIIGVLKTEEISTKANTWARETVSGEDDSSVIHTLDLSGNKIGDTGIQALVAFLTTKTGVGKTLSSLRLGGNSWSELGEAVLSGLKILRKDIVVEPKTITAGTNNITLAKPARSDSNGREEIVDSSTQEGKSKSTTDMDDLD